MCSSLPQIKDRQKGQVVLIVLLVLSVVSVIGLSIVSRSVTDIKISQQSQEAARALWVAQGGLEKAMKANIAIGASQPEEVGGVKVWVSKTGFGGGKELVFPNEANANEPVTLWLVNHDDSTGEVKSPIVAYPAGGKLTFYWGKERIINDSTPALEATLVYDESNKFKFKRYAFDPNAGRVTRTAFIDVSGNSNCSLGGKPFGYCSNEITLPTGVVPYLVRLRLIFNNDSQPVGVKGDQTLPTQGSCFEASAKIEESGVTRKLRQCQSFRVLPQIFDFLLFSGGNI